MDSQGNTLTELAYGNSERHKALIHILYIRKQVQIGKIKEKVNRRVQYKCKSTHPDCN